MLSHPLQERTGSPRDRLFLSVLLALVMGLFVAFWMVCSHQVRKAQMRDISSEVQRVAVADCLQYVPRATLISCANRVDPDHRQANTIARPGNNPAAAVDASRGSMGGAGPVSISYR